MDELLATTPPVETTPEVAPEPSPNEATPDETNLEQDDGLENAEPEFDEVDYNGNKYKVPKDLAPVLQKADSLQADYTRKTQEVAEMRRFAETQIQHVQREQQINSEISQEIGQLASVESQLAQYQNADWQGWMAQNPAAAQAGMAEMRDLENKQAKLRGTVEIRKAEVAAIHEQRSATMISQAIEQLSKPDPDKGWAGKFDVTTKDSLTKFGRDLGYTDAELAGTTHPLMIKTLNLARIGYEALKKQRASVTPPKIVANPVPQVGAGKSRSSVDPDKLNGPAWLKWREEDLKKKRG